MKQKTLMIPGMNTPRFFIWFKGFVHGRILKTAAVDAETGYIISSYVTDKCKLFNELSSNRVKQLEQELKACRVEAINLITEEAKVRGTFSRDAGTVGVPADAAIEEKRSICRENSRQLQGKRGHEEILKRLSEIDCKIRSCELNAREELDAAASALQSRFATYAHGMMVRPVNSHFIPPVEYQRSFELYAETHREEDEKIRHILKEVYSIA